MRIRFGSLDDVKELGWGRRAIVLTSEGMVRRGTLARIEPALVVAGRFTGITPNPTIGACTQIAESLRDRACDLVVAVGGGSVLDTAKAFAAQRAARPGWFAAHLREGADFDWESAPPPILAIPTTAGTGSEVTMWGTVWDEKTGKKHSIAHPDLYPEAALLDPSLTLTLPRETTVATAFDALSHAMESIWNRASNPVSDALAVQAIERIPRHLRRALEAPSDLAARTELMTAALLAGLASSNTRTALAHSISYPLTSELGLAHGFACSVTLPEILREVGREHPDRAALIVKALGASTVADAIDAVYELFRAAGVGAELKKRIPNRMALAGLKTGFIAPGRAENCLIAADQGSAAALLEKAYDAL